MQGTQTFRVTQLDGGQGVQQVVAQPVLQVLQPVLQVLQVLQLELHRLLMPLQKALKHEYSSRHSQWPRSTHLETIEVSVTYL
jgi:hypothetical protein